MFNVIFLSPHSDPEAKTGEVDSGGQCIYEYELAKTLASLEKANVTVYCRKKFDHPETTIVSKRFTIKRIVCGGNKFIRKEDLAPFLEEFATKVVADLKGAIPDVIHAHYWDGGKAAILVNSKLPVDVPIVWTPHSLGNAKRRDFRGVDPEMRYWFTPRVLWETYSMLTANNVIVSTDDEKIKVREEYGLDDDKIKIISPGIAFNNFKRVSRAEARRKLKLPMNVPIAMTLGRLDPRKGYHNCISAFAEFNKFFKTDTLLAIFSGKHGKMVPDELEYLQSLKDLALSLGVADKILFRDAVDYEDVRYIYAAANSYLCLSEYEPFGLTILEAMYVGIPVIATNSGGPRSIITQNYNGVIVNPHDYKYIAYSLYLTLFDEYFRNLLVANAKGYIRHKYTWNSRARDFMAVYEKLKTLPYNEKRKDVIHYILTKGSHL
jgi:D-inositol-3-phosphate glycosyltransferase